MFKQKWVAEKVNEGMIRQLRVIIRKLEKNLARTKLVREARYRERNEI